MIKECWKPYLGNGKYFKQTKELIERLNIEDVVTLKGNKPNAEILQEMANHDIFLFTSDKQEGWGAVANEAMSQGCILVGADQIGSVPYLIKDNENGVLFRSNDIDSLTERVSFLFEHREVWYRISDNAKLTMRTLWSPKIAAQNFLTLIDNLQNGSDSSILEGPCSKA